MSTRIFARLSSAGIYRVCASCQTRSLFQLKLIFQKIERPHIYSSLSPLTSVHYKMLSSSRLSRYSHPTAAEMIRESVEDESSSAKPLAYPCRVVAAVCVQRMPLLSREKTEFEKQYKDLRSTFRMERSRFSDFELDEINHNKMKKAREKRALEDDVDESKLADSETIDAFEDMLESRELELQEFVAAPRETEADRSGDMKSIDRKLDMVLYLLVKKPRQNHSWQMPQGGLEQGESIIEAGQRELQEECGSTLKVNMLSGTPSAVLSYRHDTTLSDSNGYTMSKVFFLKANYVEGGLQLDSKELVDYMWVTREEMQDYVSEEYYRAIAPMLID